MRWGELGTRARLRLTAAAASFGTLGATAAVMLGPVGASAVMPGPLESFHAPLAGDCQACHSSEPSGVKGVLHGLVGTQDALVQSEKCLVCHTLGEDGLHPHGWSADRLAREGDRGTLAASSVPGAAEGRLACTLCHREHRGRERALARLSDSACQTCHSERFPSFEDGHPELGTWPYGRGETPTAIAFDHAAHVNEHFADDPAAPTACTDCHVPDAAGRRMLVREFEATCAACHGAEIAGSAEVEGTGVPFLVLPSLDVLSLEDGGRPIGEWPSDSGVAETPTSPFLALLLAADEAPEADLSALRSVDPLDLLDAGEDELAAVARVAWAVKLLLRDLDERGHAALAERVGRALGRPLGEREAASALGGLPAELVRSTLAAWLPSLESETERYLATGGGGELGAALSGGDVARDREREAWVATGGWYRREADFSLRYRPGGHDDAFLRAWLELTAGAEPGTPARAVFDALSAPTAVGLCAKCHTPSREGDALRFRPAERRESLTVFSHAPHFPTLGDRGCLECHAVARSPTAPDLRSGFEPLARATCLECHGEGRARAGCVDCHAYHERSGGPALPASPLR